MKFEAGEKITDAELAHELTFFEGARASYFYTQYLCVYQTFMRHPLWPQDIVFISPARSHHLKWFWFVRNNSVFEKHLNRFLADPALLSRMERYIIDEKEKGVSLLKNAALSSLDTASLRELMESYLMQFANIMVTAGTCRMIDRGIMPELRKVFADKPNVDECIAVAAVPKKPAAAAREERAVLELALRVERGELSEGSTDFSRELLAVHDHFAWGVLGYFDEKPKEVADYAGEIRKVLQNGAMKSLSAFESRACVAKEQREKLVATLSERGRVLAEVASYATYLKDLFKFSENELEYYGEALFEEVAKRAGVSPAFVKDLHPKEILELIEGKSVDKRAVSARTAHSVVIAIPGKLQILVGKEAEKFEKKYIPSGDSTEKEFKGRVASRGFAKGVAKVVLGGKDFHKLHKGDILVVSNTSPDFVPIMRKAAAIVAEEGGLTAHVSVVSREFGIPCIVGLTHITEILKDGNEIEVDANNGMVRIIKKAT